MTFNNHKEFKKVFEQYQSDIYNFIYYTLGNAPAAEDILQEVFITLWENRKSIKKNLSLKSYLYTVAKNLSLNYIRHNKVVQKYDQAKKSEDLDLSFQTDLELKEFKNIYLEAIKTLPKQQRAVFMMSRHDDLTYKEISQRLNISIKTVETHIGRALKTLIKKLKPFK